MTIVREAMLDGELADVLARARHAALEDRQPTGPAPVDRASPVWIRLRAAVSDYHASMIDPDEHADTVWRMVTVRRAGRSPGL